MNRTIAIAALAAFALASAAGAQAQQLSWSPQKTKTRLTGELVFVPDGGASFRCKVVWTFYTGKPNLGLKDLPAILSMSVKGRNCENVQFIGGLPTTVGAADRHTGNIQAVQWRAQGQTQQFNCDRNGLAFIARSNGAWRFGPGNCLEGTLVSDPPVRIVPSP